jgi:hypothetical protein
LYYFVSGYRRPLANGYETALSGEIDKKLNRLGRSQRMRKGQPLPPQVDVKVSRSRGQRIPYSLSQVASYLLMLGYGAQALPCHFAKKNDARHAPRCEGFCAFQRRQPSLGQTFALGQEWAIQGTWNVILQKGLI